MATIRKRGKKWQVQVRRQNCPPVSRTFATSADAKHWALQQEAGLTLQHKPEFSLKTLRTASLAELIERYILEVCPTKRSASVEAAILKGFLKKWACTLPLSKLSPAPFAAYRDQRLKTVKPVTVRRELALVKHAFDVAIIDWGYPLSNNPLKQLRLPLAGKSRDRRLEADELNKLFVILAQSRNTHLLPIAQLALETGMRQGELLRMQWEDIDLTRNTIYLAITKNGHPRTIPLTPRAQELIQSLMAHRTCSGVFSTTAEAIKRAWKKALHLAGIDDFHFHDLRHEAVTRFFELGLSIPEVALISGHRDVRMLFRYTHLKPENVAKKIAALQLDASA